MAEWTRRRSSAFSSSRLSVLALFIGLPVDNNNKPTQKQRVVPAIFARICLAGIINTRTARVGLPADVGSHDEAEAEASSKMRLEDIVIASYNLRSHTGQARENRHIHADID